VEFSAAFQKLYNRAKSVYMSMELILNKKKGMCLPHASSIFKKINPKTFWPNCVYWTPLANGYICSCHLQSKSKVRILSLEN
jgi:hypothetical protein